MRKKTLIEKFLERGKSIKELQNILYQCNKAHAELKARVLPNEWREHIYYTSHSLSRYRRWKKEIMKKIKNRKEEANE